MKKINIKRTILLLIAFVIFLLIVLFLFLFSAGMSKGYDSEMIENKIKKQCQCKMVESIKTEVNSETFIKDFKSKILVSDFSTQLSNCSYPSFEDLKANVLSVLIKNNLCETRQIQFIVEDFKGEEKRFKISNCIITK